MNVQSSEVWQQAARAPTGPADQFGSSFADPDVIDRPLLESLALAVERFPDHIAIAAIDEILTFRNFWALVVHLGTALRASGAPPGPFAILLPDDAAYAAALFAGLVAGRICLPLDDANPPRRNAEVMRAANVTLVLHRAGDRAAMEAAEGCTSVAFDYPFVAADAATRPVPSCIGVDEPAYIISTSGSTGMPKLIVQSQRTMAYRAFHTIETAGLQPDGRSVFAGGSPSAYGRVAHVFPPLFVGAAIHLMNVRREGIRGLLQRLRDERITDLRAAVSLMRTISRLPIARNMLEHVRILRFGAEQPLHSDIALVRRVLPPACRIINVYSSTESVAFRWLVPPLDGRDPVRVPAGFIVPGSQAVLLDESGVPCAPGEVGELVVRSRYNSLGEWQDGRCVPGRFHPDTTDPEHRIYFTGDLARQAEDGAVIIMGRKDRQLKINGQRVEPIEVEGAIREMAGVLDVAVLPRASAETILLLAFVVTERGPRAGMAETVRRVLQERLPPYMIPARIRLLDALPRLPGGKVDGMALLAGEA